MIRLAFMAIRAFTALMSLPISRSETGAKCTTTGVVPAFRASAAIRASSFLSTCAANVLAEQARAAALAMICRVEMLDF